MKKNLVLDLDNTIISSLEFNELHMKRSQDLKYLDMDSSYRVFKRPHLEEFLDFIFKNFNVSVWTAASKEYASFIINNIILTKPDRHLEYVFFSYHCKVSKKVLKCTKDLSMLWNNMKLTGFSEDNTYIVDDLEEIYDAMPDNVYRAKYFDALEKDASKDRFLLDMISSLRRII